MPELFYTIVGKANGTEAGPSSLLTDRTEDKVLTNASRAKSV